MPPQPPTPRDIGTSFKKNLTATAGTTPTLAGPAACAQVSPNRKEIGTSFKKEAKAVTDFLEGMSECDAMELKSKLEAGPADVRPSDDREGVSGERWRSVGPLHGERQGRLCVDTAAGPVAPRRASANLRGGGTCAIGV
eukprot:112059-Chlamydomonas_euryale.AAC.4